MPLEFTISTIFLLKRINEPLLRSRGSLKRIIYKRAQKKWDKLTFD